MEIGLYEEIINKAILTKIDELNKDTFYIGKKEIDKADASRILTQYLSFIIKSALDSYDGTHSLEQQLQLTNKIILLLHQEIHKGLIGEDLEITKALMLNAILNHKDFIHSDYTKYLKEVTPYTGLTTSELFTGNNAGVSLESEIKKEILSSDKIMWLVSFIKWTGIRIFEKELKDFTNNGGQLKIITTSYMGATDYKAVEFLSSLKNTEIKISYNTNNERLHAKAYLFFRNTGFHTGYIGSSNLSWSALTKGLEWNMKITSKEVSQIIDKFYKTFQTYWENKDFEIYNISEHKEKLREALKPDNKRPEDFFYFDITPKKYQEEILEKLQTERTLHQRNRNLIVAATGTGKTFIAGFDYKNFCKSNGGGKLLFLAHRKEILVQARNAFRGILRDNNFGELWVDGIEPDNYSHLFASIQTLNNRLNSFNRSESFFDYIVFDEAHHLPAESYRGIINYFKPKVLLGLTATPERMDGESILKDFCNTIAAEIRLPEALNQGLLCPFQYFGITDSVDISNVTWEKGRYVPSELSNLYTGNDVRVKDIIATLNKYLTDIHEVRALCFCVTQEHAEFMSMRFNEHGIKSCYLVSNNAENRDKLRRMLSDKEINYLFVVDIFNEGIDIPQIDTVLFLRPTESLTVFLQQFGRGLRLDDGKELLTVFDFVANSRPEYDYEGKFRALIGKTNTSTRKEIEDDFPHLPIGCSIKLEREAKETILKNVIRAININRNNILYKIQNYRHHTDLPLTLKNFIQFYHLPLQYIYKHSTWSRLCAEAGLRDDFPTLYEKEIKSTIKNKWLSCRSFSYFSFILSLADKNFEIDLPSITEEEKLMCTMLYYDIWQKPGLFNSLEESIRAFGRNQILVEEIKELLEILIDQIDFMEYDLPLPYVQPLKVHGRYTRHQILAAFQLITFKHDHNLIEGVAYNPVLNTELLFINLIKSEKDFSPTTLYNDFAIDEVTFHWQSQNSAGPETPKGQSYINQRENGKNILLFVREKKEDEFKSTMSYVFLGAADFISYEGAKPMSIKWKLKNPMPPYLWQASAKMAVC